MNTSSAASADRLSDRPLYSFLVQFPVVLFVGTLVSDIAYWRTQLFIWETFSVWMVAAGCVMAGLAGIVGLVSFLGDRRVRESQFAWPHALTSLLAALLAVMNAFVHSRGARRAHAVGDRGALDGCGLLDGVAADESPQPHGSYRMKTITTLSRVTLGCAALPALGALTACGDRDLAPPDTQYGDKPTLPEPKNFLVPPMKVPSAGHWTSGETPKVPAGLKIDALATGLMHPRTLYTLPNGDILMIESNGPKPPVNRPKDLIMGWIKGFGGTGGKGGNRITLLRPAAHGAPEIRTVFVDGLNSPFGVALVGNDFYVANTDAVVRYPYVPGETKISAPGTKLVDLPGGPIDHHWTKSLLASEDGAKFYVGVGFKRNITENGMPAELNRAAIWEVDRATGAMRIFASGLRNPNSMQWAPQSKKMWFVVNERDEIGANLVPDYLTSVQDGGFYGWPYSYYGAHLDPRVMPQRPDLVAKAIVPDYALSSHVAPLGLVFSAGAPLSAAFKTGAFVGEHGSWDRSPVNGYKVVFVPFAEGKPTGPPKDVVTGFLSGDEQANGRPVGLALDHEGGLLIADDIGNTVWRVTAASH